MAETRTVKSKAASFGLVNYDGDGIIEGFPAVFGNVDADGDVILPGAFATTIKQRGRKAILGLDHMHGLGTTLELAEVTRNDLPKEIIAAAPDATGGLWARGQVMLTPENIGHLDTMARMIDAGSPPGMSFTYATIAERKAKSRFGRDVNELVELRLDEWGPDIRKRPRNSAARMTSVKAGEPDADGSWPVEAKAVDGSYEDMRSYVTKALAADGRWSTPDGMRSFYVEATYPDAVIIEANGDATGKTRKYYSIPYGYVDGSIAFGDPTEVDLVTVTTATAKASDDITEAALIAYINRAATRLAGDSAAKAGAVLARVNLDDLDTALALLQAIRARAVKVTGQTPADGTDAPPSTAKAADEPADLLDSLQWDIDILTTEAALLAVA